MGPPGPVTGIHDTRPALTWQDAFLSGNGEQGIMVLGAPGRERVVHTHHRFVLPNGSRDLQPPDVAGRLEEVRDLILAGRRQQAQRAFSDGRALAWTQPFHPGVVLHVDVADAPGVGSRATPAVAGYRRATSFATGEVTTTWLHGGAALRSRAFVSRPDRVAVHEVALDADPLDADLLDADPRDADPGGFDLLLRLSADTPGRPDSVAVSGSVRVVDGEAVLAARGRYPDLPEGFCGVTRLVTDGDAQAVDGGVRVRGATRVLLLTRLARWVSAPPEADLGADLGRLPTDYAALLTRHVAVHGELFGRCTLELATRAGRDVPVDDLLARADACAPAGSLDPALVEALFATGRYLLLSSCGVLPPRLTGLWLGEWGAAWSGDFTTDANLNLQVAALTITGMPELLDGYAAMLAAQADDWRLNASRLYGARGVLAPSRTDGEHGRLVHVDDDWPWGMWLAGADWLLLPLVERWQASGDDAELAALAPLLVEVARFFTDVLTRTDDDGRVVVVPSYSPEVGPWGEDGAAAVNATMDVAAARHALLTAAEVTQALGELGTADADEVRRWRDLAARLPDYRIDERGALAEWAWPGLTTPTDHRHVSHLYPVWPLHEITPDATPELAAAALAALVARGEEDASAHGSLHRALVAARLRQPEPARNHLVNVLGRRMLHRSLMTSHNPDLRIYNADAAHALPAVVVELLLGSRPGVVEVLPALPPEWVRGRLRGSPTRAGVLVEELSWDLPRGHVRVVLRGTEAREVTVICAAAGELDAVRRVALTPGAAREIAVAVGAPR